MFKTMITCDADALGHDVEKAYGIELSLRELFFEGDYMNDSYKRLSFSDDMYEDYKVAAKEDGDEDSHHRVLVVEFLRNFFLPQGIDEILVDVSW